MGKKDVELKDHALDADGVPILASIAMLRALGAVIAFELDIATWKILNAGRAIEFERAPSGHLLLDLMNLMGKAGHKNADRSMLQLSQAAAAAPAVAE